MQVTKMKVRRVLSLSRFDELRRGHHLIGVAQAMQLEQGMEMEPDSLQQQQGVTTIMKGEPIPSAPEHQLQVIHCEVLYRFLTCCRQERASMKQSNDQQVS